MTTTNNATKALHSVFISNKDRKSSQLTITLFIVALLLPLYTFSLNIQNQTRQIAIQAAKEALPKNSLTVVQNKFDFIKEHTLGADCEDTFHIVDINVLTDQLSLWQKYLPNITPHYAIKSNDDMVISSVLASLGMGFDCASEKEIADVLSMGVDPSRIIFAHPRKPNSSIIYAKMNGINLLTFDSLEELDKMLKFHPEANLLLRIKTEDSHSSSQLSQKFGATLDEAYEILDYGFLKNGRIVGIAFHVGSNCTHLGSYRQALIDSATLFQYCKDKWNIDLSLLDLGGGWPGTNDEGFIEIATMVNELTKNLFKPQTRFIAEPGRYFSAKTTTIVMRIIGKKHLTQDNKIAYYLSNGVFGFFISSLYYEYNLDLILSEGWLFHPINCNKTQLYPALLWGPTCDSGDKIIDGLLLPEMQTGAFLAIENIGAYSKSLETSFNGVPKSQPYYILP